MCITWPTLKQSYLFWIGVALATCSMIIGVLGWSYMHLNERFASEGVSADAVVLTKKKEINQNSDPRYLVEYGFSDTQGKPVRAWDAMPENVWDTLTVDQKAPIAFLRSDPTTARLTDPFTAPDGKGQLWFAACAGALAVVSFVALFAKRTSKK
jgi:hypothetical protein